MIVSTVGPKECSEMLPDLEYVPSRWTELLAENVLP